MTTIRTACPWSPSVGLAASLVIVGAQLPLQAMAAVEEIKVTARKVEETLQDAPVAVTAFTAEALENASLQNIEDVARFTPNLTYTGGVDGRVAAPVVRGIGVIDTRGFDNAVGIFVDGVFVSGRAAQNVNMLDLERVEVIRGPQSAIYGRNTFSGAINYVTKKPSEVFDSKIEALAATDEWYKLTASVSGPIIGNTLFGRIAASYDEDEGTYENAGPLSTGEGIGGHEYTTVTGTLRWVPADFAEFNLTGYYADERLENLPLSRVPNNCGELNPAVVRPTLPSRDRGLPYYYCGEVPPAGTNRLSMTPEAFSSDGDTFRISLDAKFDLSFATLTSITSYTDMQNESAQDLDSTQAGDPFYGYLAQADYDAAVPPGSPSPLINSITTPFLVGNLNTYIGSQQLDQKYWSQELRLSSNSEGRLRWLAGLYYFHNENTDTTAFGIDARPAVAALGLPASEIQFLLADTLPGSPAFLGLPQPILPNVAFREAAGETTLLTLGLTEADQFAVFGSVEFDFTERLTGTVELRYTYEERELDNRFDLAFGTLPDGPAFFKEDWDFWDPRFILRYRTDTAMIYGSVAKGSRSGGLNVLVTDPAFVVFDPEENWTYELGAKTAWFDDALTLNVSAYYIDWEDAQFRQRFTTESGGTLTATSNATGITSSGIEIEVIVAPATGFVAGLGYGYANPEFDDGTLSTGDVRSCDTLPGDVSAYPLLPINCVQFDSDGDGSVGGLDKSAPDISGKQVIRTAKHTFSAFMEATKPIGPTFDAFLRGDVSYRSKLYQDLTNTQWVPSRTLANLRLGVRSERYDLILWVENLLDEDAPETSNVFGSDLNSLNQVTTALNATDRRLGVTARLRFGGE